MDLESINGLYKFNLIYQDGRIYEGNYVDDKKEGYGVFTWPGNFIILHFQMEKRIRGNGWMGNRMEKE